MDASDTHTTDPGDRFFHELADNAPVMIWRASTDKLCDWFNKPCLDFVGRPMAQEVGNGWAENVHKDDFDQCLKTYVEAFYARERFSMVYRLRRHDGVYRELLDNGAPFYRGGVFAGYFGSCIDVSEQRDMEAQLRHSQKMEALGKLTGGIAHDFNNSLQVIGGNLSLLKSSVTSNQRAEERLRQAQLGVERCAKLAAQLLSFARKQPLAPTVIDVGRLLRATDDMLRRALGEGIEIETVAAGGLWSVLADAAQVEAAVLNLAINARDAMNGVGKLTIEAGNASLDDRYAAQHAEVSAGQISHAGRHRHGRRNICGHSRQGFRSVLHDQECRTRHGPWPEHGPRLRKAIRWAYKNLQRGRPENDGTDLSSPHQKSPGQRAICGG